MCKIALILPLLSIFLLSSKSDPQKLSDVPEANYDESKVRVENLPDLLMGESGKRIDSVEQ